MGELLSIAETAQRLKVTPGAVNKWIRLKGLPVHGVSKRSRWCDWDEVRAWLASSRKGPALSVAPAPERARSTTVVDIASRR